MIRDELGICLSQGLLMNHLDSTFTCIRAYPIESSDIDDMHPMYTFTQMRGKEVLESMREKHQLIWRAEFFCPNFHR
jgi:hypothetical protein